jgi:battenin
VESFDVSGAVGIVLAANTVSGLFSRFLNSWLVSKRVPYGITFFVNLLMMLFGLLSCAFSKWFSLECVGIFFIGFSSNLGESILLCYMSHRHKEPLLKSWGSGTGMAGIAGAGYSFICRFATISNFWSFIGVSPVVIIYGLVFYLILDKSPEEEPEPDRKTSLLDVGAPDAAPRSSVEFSHICDCSTFGKIWWYMFNCGAVYFLEYVMQGVFADNALAPDDRKKYKYSFELLNLCYQMGVFLSRSSLAFFRFPWVWILTLIQSQLFILWQTQALYHFMPFWLMCVTMVIVGLFGGCSYVNVFHMVMNDPMMTGLQKEMFTSYNSFSIAVFIFLASAFTFLAEQTYLIPPAD